MTPISPMRMNPVHTAGEEAASEARARSRSRGDSGGSGRGVAAAGKSRRERVESAGSDKGPSLESEIDAALGSSAETPCDVPMWQSHHDVLEAASSPVALVEALDMWRHAVATASEATLRALTMDYIAKTAMMKREANPAMWTEVVATTYGNFLAALRARKQEVLGNDEPKSSHIPRMQSMKGSMRKLMGSVGARRPASGAGQR